MPDSEINDRRPDVIVNLVKKFFDGNERQLDRFSTPRSDISYFGIREMLENEEEERDMPELEIEESVSQIRNQRGQGVKLLTPQQMLSRLPNSSIQLKAGNKNEIRQLLYSLYRSKKLGKTIYNNFINAISKWKQYL